MKKMSKLLVTLAEVCCMALTFMILLGFNDGLIECDASTITVEFLLITVSLILRTINAGVVNSETITRFGIILLWAEAISILPFVI